MFSKKGSGSATPNNAQANPISAPGINTPSAANEGMQQAFTGTPDSIAQVPFEDATAVAQIPFENAPNAMAQAPSENVPNAATAVAIAEPATALAAMAANVQRTPVLVPSTGKKSPGTMRAPKGRRMVITVGTVVVLLAILVGTSAAVLQAGDGHASAGFFSIFQSKVDTKTQSNGQTALIASQAATATAVMQDGYDAGGDITYAGVNRDYAVGNGQNTTDITTGGAQTPAVSAGGKVSAADLVIRATPGQCTWYADYTYWQETGYEVPWAGNAETYAWQAPEYGWINQSTPVVGSIIVIQGGVQNAGPGTGHVGIVTGIEPGGQVVDVNSWNVVAPGVLTSNTYTVGYGVSFVYHP